VPIAADQRKTEKIKAATGPGAVDDLRWWRATDPKQLADRAWTVAQRLQKAGSARRREMWKAKQMYEGKDVGALYDSGAYDGEIRTTAPRTTYNALQSGVDTAASLVGKNRPKPLFLCDGGDYELVLKAEMLTRYVAGVFTDCAVYAKSDLQFTNAAVGGTGFLFFWADYDDGKIKCERVPPQEILVDDADGARERPQHIGRRKRMNRDELQELYKDEPEKVEAIGRANSDLRPGARSESVGDVIPVVELWHFRSSKKSKDGRHVILVEGCVLLDEPWDKDTCPIVKFVWYPRLDGYWGRGLYQTVCNMQTRIDYLGDAIDEGQDLMSSPLWLVERSAGVDMAHMESNEIGRILEYSGTKPEAATPAAYQAEIYQHLQWIWQMSHAIPGVNQGMAEGKKPAGVESGEAIREVADIASGRLQQPAQRWEANFVEAARVVVDLSKDLYAERKDLEVSAIHRGGLLRIKWADVDMEADRFVLTVFPISALPSSPAGRIQRLMEWVGAGWIRHEFAMELLDIPDLDRFASRQTATSRVVQQVVELIKKSGKYDAQKWPPIPQMNLSLAQEIVAGEIVNAYSQGIGEETRLELTRYGDDIGLLLAEQKKTEQAAMQPPPGMMPPGPPMMPPGGPPQMPPGPPQMAA
jgi:hypothetical protein